MPTFQAGFANSTVTLEVNETSVNVGGNFSTVHYRLYLTRNAGSIFGGADFNVFIDGGQRAAGSNVSFSLSAGQSRVFAEGDVNIGHNGDGSKAIGVSGYINSGSGAATASGSFNLSNIPRYADITYFNYDIVTDERLQWSWAANANCDYISWWSPQIDGNAHHDIPTFGSNFTISKNNLRSDTDYQIYVAQRRADSGLWRENGPYGARTKSQNNFMDMFDTV